MFKSLKHCKKITSHQLILIQICQKVHGYVLKRLAKFEQNLWVGDCLHCLKVLAWKPALGQTPLSGFTHYVRSIPITLSVLIFKCLYDDDSEVSVTQLTVRNNNIIKKTT